MPEVDCDELTDAYIAEWSFTDEAFARVDEALDSFQSQLETVASLEGVVDEREEAADDMREKVGEALAESGRKALAAVECDFRLSQLKEQRTGASSELEMCRDVYDTVNGEYQELRGRAAELEQCASALAEQLAVPGIDPEEYERLRAELAGTMEELFQAQAESSRLEAEVDAALESVTAAEDSMNQLDAEVREAEEELETARGEREEAENEADAAQSDLDRATAACEDAKSMYEEARDQADQLGDEFEAAFQDAEEAADAERNVAVSWYGHCVGFGE